MRLMRLILMATLTGAAMSTHADDDFVHAHARIRSVAITNAQRVSENRIRATLRARPGDVCVPAVISRDMAALMALREFSDVTASTVNAPDGVHLVYSVEEAPLITALNATRDMPGKRLPRRPLAALRPGTPFTRAALFDAINGIRDYFHRYQFHHVSITSAVTQLAGTNAVAVTVHAHEGVRDHVSSVDVYGNSVFSAGALRGMLHCTPRNRWRLRDGAYQRSRLADDRQRILDAYQARGHLDARVAVTPRATAHTNQTAIVISVFEGPCYRIGTVTWRERGLTSNYLARVTAAVDVARGTPYTPALPDELRQRAADAARAAGLPAHEITVRAVLAPGSRPDRPAVDVSVMLAKPGLPRNSQRPVIIYPLMKAIAY